MLSWMIALFALATLLGWCCCGEVAVRYLGGERGVRWYRWAYCFAGGLGAVGTLSTIWTFSDLANGLMAIPNMIAIFALSGVVVKETRDFFKRHAEQNQFK